MVLWGIMCIRRAFFKCVLVAVLPSVICAAQAAVQEPAGNPGKILPPVQITSPFALHAPPVDTSKAIGFLRKDEMTPEDQRVAIAALPAIQSKAALAGFNLRQGIWSYQQITCPALPNHVILLYSRNEGQRDMSLFSVAIPHDRNGVFRVVPILRLGFSPYTPAPENPLTIAAFNQARESERNNQKHDWLLTGLCYAALAGAHVTLAPAGADRGVSALPASSPLLEIKEGVNIVHFVDLENSGKAKEWRLTFDTKGKLVNVEVSDAPAMQIKTVP